MQANSIEIHRRVFANQGMVRSLAWQMARRLPSRVESEELISEGQLGLLRAARDFDSGKGASFSTYAHWRIRGAMLDWLRAQRWFNTADFNADRLTDSVAQENEDGGVALRQAGQVVSDHKDDKAIDPAMAASQSEVRDLLRDLIRGLKGLPKEILSATVLQSETLESAGRKAGVHKGTAQRAQVRGFRELAKSIRKTGLGDMEGEELRRLVFKEAPPRRSSHGG